MRLGIFDLCAIGIFNAIGVLGLAQDIVGPLEALDQVFAILGFERFGYAVARLTSRARSSLPGMAIQASMISWRIP